MPKLSIRFATGTLNPMEKSGTKGCRMYFVTSKSTSPKNGVVSQKMRSFERPPKMRSLKARVYIV